MDMTRYYCGLDLGQAADPSAFCVVEQTERAGAQHYGVRYLERWKLGTRYPAVVARVAELLSRPPLPGCDLVIDKTGVGAAVTDLVRDAGLPCRLQPVLITAGHEVTSANGAWHVPKKELVSTLQVLLQSGRLAIARSLSESETLATELQNFKVAVTAAGNETFGAWRAGQHDDLVLALGLAVWYAERRHPPIPRIEGDLVLNFRRSDPEREHDPFRAMERMWGKMSDWGNF